MIFIKYNKMFLTFCIFIVIMQARARSISVSQMGDVRIVVTDDKWQCDQIECPLDAYRCYVSKSNSEDPSVLKRVNICYSKDNQILAQSSTSTSTDPNHQINARINSSRNGAFSTISSTNDDFDEKKFKEQLNNQMHKLHTDLQNQLGNINKGLDNQMKDLHSNLANMNKNIAKNMENQMYDLEQNLSNMQYNLAHMFD